jgi:hypothetical protein
LQQRGRETGSVGACFEPSEGEAAVETFAKREQLLCWLNRVRGKGSGAGCFEPSEGHAAVETLAQRDQLPCGRYRVRERGTVGVGFELVVGIANVLALVGGAQPQPRRLPKESRLLEVAYELAEGEPAVKTFAQSGQHLSSHNRVRERGSLGGCFVLAVGEAAVKTSAQRGKRHCLHSRAMKGSIGRPCGRPC